MEVKAEVVEEKEEEKEEEEEEEEKEENNSEKIEQPSPGRWGIIMNKSMGPLVP